MPFYPAAVIWQSCVSHLNPALPECCNCLQAPTSNVIKLFEKNSFHILSCADRASNPPHIIYHLHSPNNPLRRVTKTLAKYVWPQEKIPGQAVAHWHILQGPASPTSHPLLNTEPESKISL